MAENEGRVVHLRLPGKDEPGYLRRLTRALELNEQLKSGPTPQLFTAMVEFLAPLIDGTESVEQAKEIIWDLSENQFRQAFDAMLGGDDDPNE